MFFKLDESKRVGYDVVGTDNDIEIHPAASRPQYSERVELSPRFSDVPRQVRPTAKLRARIGVNREGKLWSSAIWFEPVR